MKEKTKAEKISALQESNTDEDYGILKSKFLKIFANVASPLRDEIIAAIGDDTFTWYSAKAEIENNTEKAKKILEQLKKIGVLE